MMGTVVTFTLFGGEREANERAIRAAAEEMQRIDQYFTIYGEGENPVRAFNKAAIGEAITLPAEIDALLHQSLTVQQASHGAFDPALGELNMLWGFSKQPMPESPPQTTQIRRIAQATGDCIKPAEKQSWRRANIHCKLDFGAIAKGYAIERGMAVLRENHITDAMINAGGDIRLIGSHGERPWRIGIRHPRHRDEVLGTLMLKKSASVVTSGDYERFYIFNGERYHHILDPQTGIPAQASQSATVLGEEGAQVDAWSTALFVLGPKGLKIIEKLGMDGLVVDQHGTVHMTDGFRSRLQQ